MLAKQFLKCMDTMNNLNQNSKKINQYSQSSELFPKEELAYLVRQIKYPSITEKTVSLYSNRYYTFIVDRKLTKTQIKYVLQNLFQVTITDINTCILPLKTKRVGKFVGKRARYKKAYIKVKEGQTIADFLI